MQTTTSFESRRDIGIYSAQLKRYLYIVMKNYITPQQQFDDTP